MNQNLHKILAVLAKELTAEVTKNVTDRLRETYVEDVKAIVKEYINNNGVYSNSASGWITLNQVAKKYEMTIKSIGRKCLLFKTGKNQIDRKWVGKHNMLNEAQFLAACDIKMGKPEFLKNFKKAKKAA